MLEWLPDMWITRDVNLPDELIAAARKGRLVLFAGAGVSLGSPSNLPDFAGLADQIAGAAATREQNELLDQFLGRCEGLGVNVQRRAREILDAPGSRYTSLHVELLRLFGKPDRIRLVTTNFDRHFASAATDLYGANAVGFYHAPALPLGASVTGIVHVHGALDEMRHPLVLTDADFGRAYLTEAWATRFLLDLFLHNTVCFVGYSHNDPTMHYLARALVPGTPRFALTPPSNERRWALLGIKTIVYPLRDSGERHGSLSEAIQTWATDAVKGILEHEHQIKELVSVPPAADAHLIDYLRDALSDPTRRGFFLRYARGPDWLQFATDAGLLDSQFESKEPSDSDVPVANWLAENFMMQHPSELLALFRARRLQLGHVLWQTLAWHLYRVEPRPSAALLARWVTVLVTTRGSRWSTDALSNLLEKCSLESIDTALLLFAHLTEATLVIKEPWGDDVGSDGVLRFHVDVVPAGDQHTIRDGWEKVLVPTLPDSYSSLASILTNSLTLAHQLLLTSGAGTGAWDALSFGRAAIEEHPQDSYPSSVDVVVDCARDTLEFMLKEEPEAAAALISLWENSKSSLLRRLAIHGRTENPQFVAKEELDRVLAAGWLGQLSTKHEVFRLLAKAYAIVDEATRASFLQRALAVMTPTPKSPDPEDDNTDRYEQYNLLVWLRRAAPDSVVTMAAFEAAQAADSEFREREHPDLSHWSSGVYSVQARSPITVEGLLAKPAADQLAWLREYEGSRDTFEGPGREGLLLTVREAAESNFQWGWDLARALIAAGGDDRGIWGAIVGAWKNVSLTAEQWANALSLLQSNPAIERAADRSVADLLDHAMDDTSATTEAVLNGAIQLSERLVGIADLKEGIVAKPPIDWLLLAINHTAGKAMLSWLRALGRLREKAGDSWTGIPAGERERIHRVISGTTQSSERARTIIASQAHFLFGLDPDWWRSKVLPLFDWSADETRAIQSWSGYLKWGRWNNALFAAMRPYLDLTYQRLSNDVPDLVEGLAVRLAGVALFGTEDPWHGGWLERFIADAGDVARRAWVHHMSHELRGLKPEAITLVWDRWMADFWRDRLTGVPRPFDPGEREGIAEWIPSLEPVIGRTVALLEQMPVPIGDHTPIFYQLLESGLASREPVAAARIVRHLLIGATPPRWECGQIDSLTRLFIEAKVERSVLLDICEAMARVGCPSAGELRAMVPS